MGKRPYLSIITYCRNDDYAGGILPKLQFTLDILFTQLENHQIESEYILVDWNPPRDKTRLKDAVNWPSQLRYTSVRVIEIEPEIHRRYTYWEKRDVHPAIAVNAGIRRARGYFIVQKVADVVWSNELVSFIASKALDDDVIYRCNRKDTSPGILSENLENPDRILEWCQNNVVETHGPAQYPPDLPSLHTNAGGDFQLMSRNLWWKMRGYYETFDVSTMKLENIMAFSVYAAGHDERRLSGNACVYKIKHDAQFNVVHEHNRFPDNLIIKRIHRRIYTYFVKYILSLGLPQFQQRAFMTFYRLLFGQLADKYRDIPVLPGSYYLSLYRNIIRDKASVLNKEDWGLNEHDLSEFYIIRADWDL
jgi:glycosyltransferase involved in cell wall biosynthesis